MQERAYRFGRAQHLVGVAGLPSSPADGVGVILLNAGLVHRIGPFRLYVEMTRRLNACGYPSLRFDLSTLGDSRASAESQSAKQQIRADIADAITLLGAQSGCKRFVLIGLCSGAENAHIAACTDTRVSGAVLLDGYAYRTSGFLLRHYLPKVLSPERWRRYLMRRWRPVPAAMPAADFDHEYPPLAEVRAELADMLARGLRLCFIYSGGVTKYFNHVRQFRECFGRLAAHPGVSVSLLDGTDHTYILSGDRNRLLDAIEHWMQHNFPIDTAGNPT
ncbi:MAG TPA: alpha/beta hydrolase [Rhodanobacter sp.]